MHFIRLFLILLFFSSVNAQQIICTYCGKAIKGNYTVVEGNAFHPEHFLCAICNKPIGGNYTREGGKFYHVDCYKENKSPKCSICAKSLTGEYYVDTFGNKYHSSHDKEFSKCSNCGRIICPALTGGGRSYGDGRNMCGICFKTAIFADGDIERLLTKVKSTLYSLGLNLSNEKITIKGVGLYELKRLLKEKGADEDLQGLCKSEKLVYSKTKSSITHDIYILNGTPSIVMESVIAHELMHSWIFENSKKEISLADNEGSCNYISYLYLRTAGGADCQYLLNKLEKNQDPVYGKGFENIKSRFQGRRVNELLAYLSQ